MDSMPYSRFNYRKKRKYSSDDLRKFRFTVRAVAPDVYLTKTLTDIGIYKSFNIRRGSRAGRNRFTLCKIRHIETIQRIVVKQNLMSRPNIIKIKVDNIQYRYPSILFNNCRSIIGKFDEIQAHMFSRDPHIAIFVETWIDANGVDAFEIDGYKSFHRVRLRSDKHHGGGVSIYMKNDITIHSSKYPDEDEVEVVTITFRTGYMQREVPWIAIIAVYSPPANVFANETINYVISEVDRILSINCEANILVLGDFNDLDIENKLKKPIFSQIINQPTCNKKLIDKCFVKGSIKYNVCVSPAISTSDHKVVELTPINYIIKSNNVVKYQTRPKRRSCYRLLGQILSSVDWIDMLSPFDCENASVIFHSFIYQAYSDCFPMIWCCKKRNSRSWFNDDIAKAIDERNTSSFQSDSIEYKMLIDGIKSMIKSAKLKEYNKSIVKINEGSLDFYKLVKQFSSNQKDPVKIMFTGLSEEESLCKVFDFFKDVANQHPPLQFDCLPAYLPGKPLDKVSEAFVYAQLKRVKSSMSSAPDGVPNFVLKEYAVELTTPITVIINKSLEEGLCPSVWKDNFLITIKKKSINSPSDLRPIVISSYIVKIVERHIASNLLSSIIDKIDKNQFGGLPGRSTEHYLTFYLDYVMKNLDTTGNRVTAIVTDFSRAFDAIDHNLFINNLISMNPQPMVIKWISSFINDRNLIFKNNKCLSDMRFKCNNGAPQGSVLGGLIFCITVNNMACNWENRLKFVDDLTILCSQSSDCDGSLPQAIVESLICDSNNSKMSLNLHKCQFLVHKFSKNVTSFDVSFGGVAIKRVSECNILGITLQSDLKWDSHVANIISKASRRLFILYKLRSIGMNIPMLVRAYIVYIRPCLEYCCTVWCNALTKHQILMLESVQRRVLKIILKDSYITYESALIEVGIISLEKRREELFYKYAIKFMKLYPMMKPILRNEYTGRNTRLANYLCVPKCRTKRYQNSSVPRMIKAINLNIGK